MSKASGPKKVTRHKDRPRSDFSRNLIAIRKRKGLTQIDLAQKMGVTQRVITFYECESKGPSAELLKTFAAALNVAPGELLGKPRQVEAEESPSLMIRKRWPLIAQLPYRDQRSLAKIIDGLALQHGLLLSQ